MKRKKFKEYFDINKIDSNKNIQIIFKERGYGKLYIMEKLELKKKMNELVDKYVKLSNEEFRKGNLELSSIYNDMKNDILNLISICIVRNKF